MSGLDLGKYTSDYSNIFPVKKVYEAKITQDYSPIKVFEAMNKKNKEKVFLKVIDKIALEEEDNYEFLLNQIEKEKEISKSCNSDYTLNFNKKFETENVIVIEKEYCDNDLKEKVFEKGPFEQKMFNIDNL